MFGSSKQDKNHGGVTHPSDSADGATGQRPPTQWRAWRRSAQKVSRAWNEWLAASRREHAEFYDRYLTALVEEEQAATDLQRAVLGASDRSFSDCIVSAAQGR